MEQQQQKEITMKPISIPSSSASIVSSSSQQQQQQPSSSSSSIQQSSRIIQSSTISPRFQPLQQSSQSQPQPQQAPPPPPPQPQQSLVGHSNPPINRPVPVSLVSSFGQQQQQAQPQPQSQPGQQRFHQLPVNPLPVSVAPGFPVSRHSAPPQAQVPHHQLQQQHGQDGQVLSRRKLQELVHQAHPHMKLDQDVENILLDMADEFVENVTHFSCQLARHRGSDTLEPKDLKLLLERQYHIRVPGFSEDETGSSGNAQNKHIPHVKRVALLDGHKQRLEAVKKARYQLQQQKEIPSTMVGMKRPSSEM